MHIDSFQCSQRTIFEKRRGHVQQWENTIQDVLTRYVKLVATLDNSAETAVQVLIDEWITQFDLPEVISSDQGPHFTAIVFETICRELGIEHARGSPEHAQSQGQVER